MDTKQSLDIRTYKYSQYCNTGKLRYQYEKDGILTKSLPKIVWKGNNILVSFLQLVDMRLIMYFNYIDRLKHFKHITWFD